MNTRLLLPLACALLVTGLQADNEVYRTWTDSQGRKLEATFRGIEDGNVFLQVRNGYVYRLPLDKLSAADQQERFNQFGQPGTDDIKADLARQLDAFFNTYADPKYDIWKGGGSKAKLHTK